MTSSDIRTTSVRTSTAWSGLWRGADVARPRRRRPAALPLVALGYLALSCWLFRAGWRHLGELTYGGNDAYLFSWFLRWTPHALAGGLDPFVTHRINAPAGTNVLWSTPVPLLGLVAAPITALGGPVTTLTVLLTLAPVASGLALFVALRRWVRDGPAALAGLLYGFGPYLVGASYGHLHLAFAPFPPLLLMLLDDLVVRGRSPRRTGVLLGLVVAGQALVGEEVLATSALAAVIGLGVLAAWHRDQVRDRLGPALRGFATAGLVAVVLLAWPLGVQFLGAQRVHGSIQPSGIAVSDLWTFLTPTPMQRLAPDSSVRGSLRFTGNAVEVGGYLGLPLVLLSLAGAIGARRHPLVRVLAPLGLVMAVLSLGDHLHVGGRVTGIPLPWLAGERVPVLRNALPSRFALYVMLCVAAVAAVGLDRLADRWAGRRAGGHRGPGTVRSGALTLAAGVLTAGALAALVPAPLLTTPARTPAFFTGDGVRQLPADALTLVVPYPRPTRAEAMLWQARADFRFVMPGCYCTVPGPDGRAAFHGPGDALTTALIDVDDGTTSATAAAGSPPVRAAYARLDPDAVVLGPTHRSDELRSLLASLVGCAPRHVEGVDLWLPDRCR
ncbi:conserved membrane hypothetical protein [Frankia canadensis]|uniref:Glycosyltransferase RgtA/B/C/D-like domain-containing protein n=1 Tax=Frankia canadensis TaxID=1836972 RepID=A0A2I2KTG8_9ACTN|nr:hypothetical protein [Frankia canadensis]SNQ48952.1 conserved membrane hypothetical protein [Frankia canadensis]SOU56242.1 conserved membrane hypothetical protein [Frankia canadensis]